MVEGKRTFQWINYRLTISRERDTGFWRFWSQSTRIFKTKNWLDSRFYRSSYFWIIDYNKKILKNKIRVTISRDRVNGFLWKLLSGGFLGRWQRIRAQIFKIRNGRSNEATKIYSVCDRNWYSKVFEITDNEFKVRFVKKKMYHGFKISKIQIVRG